MSALGTLSQRVPQDAIIRSFQRLSYANAHSWHCIFETGSCRSCVLSAMAPWSVEN